MIYIAFVYQKIIMANLIPCHLNDVAKQANTFMDGDKRRLTLKYINDHQQIVIMEPGDFVGQRTDAGIAENGLHDVSTAHHMGNGDGHDADIGGQDIPQAVPPHNFLLGQALGFAQQHIVCSGFLQQLVADHVSIVPKVLQYHDDQRKDQMFDSVQNIILVTDIVSTATWE